MKQTITNLTKAFIGESLARNRYTFYAKIAKKEGHEQISEIFLTTAENEREHAKWLLIMLNELLTDCEEHPKEIAVDTSAPTTLGTTLENLNSAIDGEHYENSEMYPEFAKIAKEEGFPHIAERLENIAKAEAHHEERFRKLATEVERKTTFKKEKPVVWVCRKCGFVHTGTTPPEKCPSCDHPKNYFEVNCEAY